ncbi:MAG: U32 family peptidase, partial [Clostridiales bacterium]|nr:U32 family peptidase [Clostridiales bacterium]
MEICAPAGNIKAFYAAVNNGADAVYLGLDKYNLRIKAENFDVRTIGRYVDYAHLFGVRVFLALNSCIKQFEYRDVLNLIEKTGNIFDAYIITDLSLIERIKNKAPKAAVHISTQAGICNKYGAKLIENLGADRVVLSRETDLKSIESIKTHTSLEVEVFVHGALCVSFSGACLFSSVLTGKSGNRGACLQPCRQKYYQNGKEGYFISPKDLCLLKKLDTLKSVDAIKIEGRLKRPEYVAESVKTYRKVIDEKKVSACDIDNLKKIYNRGDFCDGYLFGNDIISPDIAAHKGLLVGKICDARLLRNNEYSEISIFSEYSCNKGDGYKILRDGKEVTGGEIYDIKIKECGQQVAKQILTVRADKSLKLGDSLHITSDVKRLEELNNTTKKLPLYFSLRLKAGEPVELEASCGDGVFLTKGQVAQTAKNRPITREAAIDILKRIDEKHDVFEIKGIEIDSDEAFYPVSSLNSLRRDAITGLKALMLKEYADKAAERMTSNRSNIYAVANKGYHARAYCSATRKIAVEVQRSEQLCEALNMCDSIIYAPDEYSAEIISGFLYAFKKNNRESRLYLKLPAQAYNSDLELIDMLITKFKSELYGIAGDNPYALYLSKKHNINYFAGLFHNIYNNEIKGLVTSVNPDTKFLLSAELNEKECSGMKDDNSYI